MPKSVENLPMSSVALASSLVKQIGGRDGSVKERIRRAAVRLHASFSYNRVSDLYRGRPRCRIAYDEIVELQKVAKAYPEIEATRDALSEVKARIARIENALRIADEDFHRPQADLLGELIGDGGRMDRAVDEDDLLGGVG